MKLNQYIDHTILKPSATEADVTRICKEAAAHQFASVCINPCHVALAKRLLEGSGVKVCTVIGFPLGANTSETKAFETERAYADGCDEFDMVLNIGYLKAMQYEKVSEDIKAVVKAAKGKCVKVIIETGLLTDEEKIKATALSCAAGAQFVKTCTGFSAGVAEASDVALMKQHVTNGVKVKASAGIKTREKALELIEAGADRLGTSSGTAILEG